MNLFAQLPLHWAQQLGGNSQDIITKIVVDDDGNIYGVGDFLDSLDNFVSYGSKDIICFKYAPNGTLLWKKHLGSSGEDLANDLCIDGNGFLYLAGQYRNTLYYDNDSLPSAGGSDALVLKMDGQGNIIWTKSIGNSSYELASSITCDRFGNTYIGGTFESALTIDNQALNAYNTLNNFILKLGTNGSLVWNNTLSTPTFNNIHDLKVDRWGNLHTIGTFRDGIQGPLWAGSFPSNGGKDAFWAIFNGVGLLTSIQKLGGTMDDFGLGIPLDTSYVYITGIFQDTAIIGTDTLISDGEFDTFITQYDLPNNSWAQQNWTTQIGGSDDSRPYDLVLTNQNNLMLVGYFEGAVWTGIDTIYSRTPRHLPSDIFITEYTSNGSLEYLHRIGSTGRDWASSIAIDDNQAIYIAGVFEDTVAFDSTTTLNGKGSADIFLAKYSLMPLQNSILTTNNTLNATLFPNPLQQEALITINLMAPTTLNAIIYNNLGQPVQYLLKNYSGNLTNQVPFDKQNLPPGIYHVHLTTANQQAIVLPFVIAP